MKINISRNNWQNILKSLIFIVLIIIIVQLFPERKTFNYQFEIGKPWSYELVTASFDFPIYKTNRQIEIEKQEILKNFVPYFFIDTIVSNTQIKKFTEDFQKAFPYQIFQTEFFRKKFFEIYSRGIISVQDFEKLNADRKQQVIIINPDRTSKTIEITELYTPKNAYEAILSASPETLKSLNLNLYITNNLKYDSLKSETAKTELLKNFSLTSGMVQTGERIIDRGEIVTADTYQILISLKKASEERKVSYRQTALVTIGRILIISGEILLFFLYVYLFRPRIFDEIRNLILISSLMVLMIALTTFIIKNTGFNYFILPYALLPIMVRVFYDSRTALFAHIITMMIIALMVDNSFRFLILQIFIGMAAVSSLKDMTQRSQLAQTAFIIFLCYTGIYLAHEFIIEGEIRKVHWLPILYFAISSTFLLFAYVLIYIFEKVFGLISAVTLVELTNINSDLMMEFAEKAPGTFQHTLQVSNLATEAAKKIGANSLLVRTGALYHDIGKMKNPDLFVENQMGEKNPLIDMDYEAAALEIIKHVSDGVEIAKKSHLPEQIIHFITTHHGLSKTKYFYNSFINAHPELKPNDEAFTYHGPLPDSKETAILMMADAVEARSRSLKNYTLESINEMVDSMIDSQIADGQFKNAPISFRDVETVKDVFKQKIKNMYHSRIVYPEVNKKN
jgi:putative nucleotidyltransferase with HDIG domain